jgi:hypothetical protein
VEEYRIRIHGLLDPCREAYFAGMTMSGLPNSDTELTGAVPDQAALYALISRIRDLGLTLLLVEKVAPPPLERTEQID